MRRLLLFALALLAWPLHAQLPPPTFTYVTVAPSGACVGTPPIQIVYFTGAAYVCANGVWATLGGGTGGGGGTGTVLSFSASPLSPLFTVGVTNPTTTPALGFTLSPVGPNTVYAGPASGGSGLPSFQMAPFISAANMTSFPTFNQNTTGNAATATLATTATNATTAATATLASQATASDHTPTLCSTGNAPTGVDANWNAVGCAAIGGGGGGGPTIETNGTNNSNQTLLNFTTTSTIAFSNPSGGVESAAIVSPGANTVLGFNGSNVYAGFTAGTGISLAGGQITATSTGNLSGTLTSGDLPVATGANTLGNSLATDNGTTLAYGGTGGISAAGGVAGTGTTPGAFSFTAGSGNIPALAANSAGFAAPVTGGTAYLLKLPATITQGFLFAATPATGDNVNESALTVASPEFTLSAGTANYGQYSSGTLIASAKMTRAGHFENLEIANVSGSCAAGSVVNVHDLTTATSGTGVAGPTTGSAGGVFADQAQTLTWAAGDRIAIMVDTVGTAPCTGNFIVNATGATP